MPTSQFGGPTTNTVSVNKKAPNYPVQSYPVQVQDQTEQSKDQSTKASLRQDNSKLNLLNSRSKTPEPAPRFPSKVDSLQNRRDQEVTHSGLMSQIVPLKQIDANDRGANRESKSICRTNTAMETDSMKRIINKMTNEEVKIMQKLEGLEKRSFPNSYPNQPSFPDSFPNSLLMKPVSNEQLHNFSKQKLDLKKQQKEVLVNYKQETDFYRRFLPMNEQKKLRLHQEINELKQNSTIINANTSVYEEDMMIQRELEDIERLKQLTQQNQYANPQNMQGNRQQYQQQPQNNFNVHTDANFIEEIDYNPYSSVGYQQNMQEMSGNYQHNSNFQKANNQGVKVMSRHGAPLTPQKPNEQQPYAVNNNFNPSYNFTAFFNKDANQENRGTPISQHTDNFIDKNQNNSVHKQPRPTPPPAPRSKINTNNPLLNML